VSSSSVRKRSTKRTASKRTQQLEDKLDEVVSLLRTQGIPQAGFQTVTPRSLSLSPQEDAFDTPSYNHVLTDEELAVFRQQHLPLFPLVFLPASLSAMQITREKPLVALAIKTICNKRCSYQKELSKEVRQTMATRLLVNGEKSLDLLLSVLICMTW
jgi:hypothetical protein